MDHGSRRQQDQAGQQGDNSLYASPEWTPDGNYIIASKTNSPIGSSYQLWMFHKDGGPGVSLTKDDKGQGALGTGRGTNINSMGPAFGNDGRYVWYARKRGGFGYNIEITQWQLAIFDRRTGRVFPRPTPTAAHSVRCSLPTGNGWSTATGGMRRPASGCATSPRGRALAGLPDPAG